MPSQTVSFSEEGYMEIIANKPDDVGFSEWIETLALERLKNSEENNLAETSNN